MNDSSPLQSSETIHKICYISTAIVASILMFCVFILLLVRFILKAAQKPNISNLQQKYEEIYLY